MFKKKLNIEALLISVRLMLLSALIFLSISSLSAKNYGRAGCGAGATSSGSSGLGIGQTSVATSNGFAYSQLFGISSGTSNCDAGTEVSEYKQRKEKFVAVNYSVLQTEMAAGKGENLNALSQLMGCSNSTIFGNMTKENYNYFFSDSKSSPKDFIKRLNTKIQNNTKLSATCKVQA